MKPPTVNIAPPPAFAGQTPLLSPTLVRPAAMEADMARACSQADARGVEMVPQLMPLVKRLGRLSSEWNAPYFDSIIYNHIMHYREPAKVAERLSAEIDFFHSLYGPAERFMIYPADEYWFDDLSVFSTIVFAAGGRAFGCADFVSLPEAMVLEYIQGAGAASSAEQREQIGMPWFEAFMERAIEAYAGLHRMGVGLMLKIEANDYRLPRMVRDRYFQSKTVAKDPYHPLALDKKRVKRILKP